MFHNKQVPIVLLLLFCLKNHPDSHADDFADSKFRAEKVKILADLRSTNRQQQSQGLTRLREFPTTEAAELAMTNLDKLDNTVKGEAASLLRYFVNTPEVGKAFHAAVVRDVRAKRVTSQTYARALVLLSANEPQVTRLVDEFLLQAEKNPLHIRVLIGAIDLMEGGYSAHRSLEYWNDSFDLKPLHRLADSSLALRHAGLKRAVIQHAMRTPTRPFFDLLIKILPTAEGEGQNDIHRFLRYHSQIPAAEKVDWVAWWEQNRETFTTKMTNRPRYKTAGVGDVQPTLTRVPLTGKRIVLIGDYTIPDPNVARQVLPPTAVQKELLEAISKMPDGTHFNVFIHNPDLTPWQRELQVSSAQSRQDAARFAQATASGGKVYLLGKPVEAALALNADAIYYYYNHGQASLNQREHFDYLKANAAKIFELNRTTRASIHSIAFTWSASTGFVNDLSTHNFGAELQTQ